jgi:hypothetical protein
MLIVFDWLICSVWHPDACQAVLLLPFFFLQLPSLFSAFSAHTPSVAAAISLAHSLSTEQDFSPL